MKIMHSIGTCLMVIMTMAGLAAQSLQASDNLSIAVYGASGRIGEVIVDVALERGHKVIGVSRKPEKLLVRHQNFTAISGDLMDVNSITALAREVDAIVISISARADDNKPEHSLLVRATENVQAALDKLKIKPYIVQIGGANLMYGSTFREVKENMQDASFSFDEGTAMHAVLFGHQISLEMYQASKLSWTIVAPPIKILGIYENRDKTTTKESYRTSVSEPLVDKEGNNTIYVRDLARAVVNEIENRNFVRQVFTVGY